MILTSTVAQRVWVSCAFVYNVLDVNKIVIVSLAKLPLVQAYYAINCRVTNINYLISEQIA